MRKILLFLFVFFSIGQSLYSQSCIPTNLNGSTIVISCNAPCSDIRFQVPHLKTTEDYVVNSIPYNAFAYTGGTQLTSTYIDDVFSPLISIGFPFCFYGQTYNDIVIGSNAVVTFDGTNADAFNEWQLQNGGTPAPIPCNIPVGGTYYPRASIMGVYQDINPNASPLPTRRIEYRVEGTAPCRKFVVSYQDIRMFGCDNLIATNQIVIYENTGVVEVFIKDKPLCSTWNNGLGIIGVQDYTRTKAVAAPGKNCTPFSENNTGYRFVPSGTTSRYISSELLTMGGAVVALADTATTVPGILDITFPNICPGPSVTQYVVRTRFTSCPVGPIMENLDTINVVRNNVLPVAVDSVPTTCNTNSGSITITPSAGVAPYTATATGPGGPYNYNGASPIVFSNLPAGNYSIYVTDNFGCDTSFNVTVTAITSLTQTSSSTPTSCAGVTDGTITVTPTSGVAPFTGVATGPGGPYTVTGPAPLVFTNLPSGSFNITYTDALGCTGTLTQTVNAGAGLTAVPSRTNTSCFGGSDGSLTITPTVPGTYSFVLNPGGFTNTTGVFTGLVAGSYQCTWTNAAGCSGTMVSLVVLSGPQLTGTHTFTNASCSGAPDGTITVTPNTPGSYTYMLNPGGITNTTGVFTGLTPGTYSVLATSSVGCSFVRSNIVINAGSSLSGTATSATTTCPGATDGTITVTPGTAGTYTYVITPGGATNTTGIFTGLATGTYSVLATNASGCTFTVSNITVTNGPAQTGSATTNTTTCPGATDGTITVTPGTAGTYTYILNPGGATNTTGTFTGLAAGTYTATGTNTVTGCIFTVTNINVTNGPALTGSATTNTTTCPGATDGTITVTPTNPGTYTYVITPGGTSNTTGTFTGLATGSYSVTATGAIGCSFTVSNINVTNGPAPTGNATTNTTSCPSATDGTITVTPTNPGTYTYVLTPGGTTNTTGTFTGLAVGTYSVTATSAIGCSFTVSNINVTAGTSPTGNAATATTTCPGATDGTITVTPTNPGTYTYVLTPGGATNTTGIFTALAPGAYSVTATNAFGCSFTLPNINVTNGPAPTGNATTNTTTCPGATDGSLTVNPTNPGTYTYVLTPGGATNTTGIFTALAPGAYSVTATSALGCSFTVSNINVTDGPAPTGNATTNTTTCPGATDGSLTVTPTNPGTYTYVLTPGGATNTTGIFTALAPGAYSVTATSALGCSFTVSNINVTDGPAPTGNATTNTTTCPGATDGSITVTPTNPGTYTYVLTPGGATNTTGIFTALAPGSYIVTGTHTVTGCVLTVANINVTDGPAPTGNATTNTTTCPGATDGSITVSPTNPGAYTYVLTPGGATNTTGIFTALATGTYSVTATNAIGCSFTVNNINVTNGAVPISNGSSTATSCPTVNNGSISVTEPGVAGTTTFTLNPGGISNTTGIFNGLAAGSYTVTFATAIGCTGTVTPNLINVAAGPTLTSTVAQTNPVCNNINDGVISITPETGTTAPYFATLTGPGGPYTYNGPAPMVFSNLAPGSYSYSYSEAGGCAGTGGPVTLTSNPAISSRSTLLMPGCNGFANGTVTFNPTGGVAPYSYTSLNAGIPSGNVFSGLSANIAYQFTITDAVGCTKDTTITLTEPAVLVASATSPSPSTCFGNDGTITVSATGGTTAYQYSINGTAFQNSPSFVAPNIGAYNVVVVKDAKGCKDTTNVTVLMVDTMRLNAGADTVVCAKSSVTLQPQANAISPSAITWQWSALNAPSSTIANPGIQNAVVSPTDTATYVVHAIWGLCERWDTLTINVLHEPIAYAGNDTAICHRSTAILVGSHTNSSGPVIYTWTPNLYLTNANAPVTTVISPDAGVYTYTLNVQDNYGCNFHTTDAMQLVVTPPVPAFAGHDTIAVLGEQHQLYGSGGVQYTWSPAAPLNNAAAQNPVAVLYNDTRFTLEVMDIAGCKGWDTVFIKVYAGPTYYVPTAFSPNGDGRNDIFRPIPSGIVKTNWFRVYNRFGNLLFETNEWLKGWDGRYRGRKQPIGAYVWVIQGVDNKGKTIEKKGTVILVE